MENRKMTFDGVTYNCFTDEELEDLKTVIAYEERKKNKTFEPIDFDDFLEEREKKYWLLLFWKIWQFWNGNSVNERIERC